MEQIILDDIISLQPQLENKNIFELSETASASLLIELFYLERKDLVLALIDAGLDINSRNWKYETLLAHAILEGDYVFTHTLVELGANPFQTNDLGLTMLDMAFKGSKPAPTELFVYLVELGLNPYNNCKYSLDSARLTAEGPLLNVATLQSKSSFTKPDNDYRDCIIKGDLNTALTILTRLLNNVGKLHEGVPLNVYIQGILSTYSAVLHLTGEVEQASILLDYLSEVHNLETSSHKDIRRTLSYMSLFTERDKFFNECNRKIRSSKESELSVATTYILEYFYYSMKGKLKKENVLKRMEKYFDNRSAPYSVEAIVNIFVYGKDFDFKQLERIIIKERMLENIHLKVTNLYMIYLIEKEDYMTAKYFAMKLNQIDQRTFVLEDYILHLLLLEYIEKLETSAE